MKYNNTKAFTLIEIIVVTGIVTVAFVSLIALVHRAISLYYNNKNVLIANALAQEGLELARFVRDDNWMTTNTYSTDNYFAYQLNVLGETNQIAGSKKLFSIDPRITINRITTRNLGDASASNPVCFWANRVACTSGISCDATTIEGLKDCLRSVPARIYRDNTTPNPNNIVFRHVYSFGATPPYNETLTPNLKYTGFNRLIFTEYRDGDSASNKGDDYVHVESWVYWVDHGREKFFHIDTDLYDYSWRYAK